VTVLASYVYVQQGWASPYWWVRPGLYILGAHLVGFTRQLALFFLPHVVKRVTEPR